MNRSPQKSRKPHPVVKPTPQTSKFHRTSDNFAVAFFRNHWDVLIVIATVCFIYSLLPLGTAIGFGGDEGYELMKSFLVSKGFKLYKEIWCDQPPGLPTLFGSAFRLWGPSLLVARLIAAGFGLILFGTFFEVVRKTAGGAAAFFATFMLLASPPNILELSVSVMQEVPAFALALASTLSLFHWCDTKHRAWIFFSGILMGLALSIKFSAALLIPAVLAEILTPRGKESHSLKNSATTAFIWFIATAISLGFVLLPWGRDSIGTTWHAQSVTRVINGMERPEDFPFSIPTLLGHTECATAAVIGLIIILSQKRRRRFLFPGVLLFTTFAVHLLHRPWWNYYYLHTAIPMAWLAGFALSECAGHVLRGNSSARRFSNTLSKQSLKTVALIVAVAFVVVRSELRLEANIRSLRHRDRTDTSSLLAKMKQYAPKTHWIFAQNEAEQYAFAARLPMPPELAVVSLKRFWSGQITTDEIIHVCRHYQPEQLLMKTNLITESWNSLFLDYTNVCQEQNYILYVRK